MLVLSRKESESITVDSDIQISVISINGNRVKLGIEAPESVVVVRTELLSDGSSPSTGIADSSRGSRNRGVAIKSNCPR